METASLSLVHKLYRLPWLFLVTISAIATLGILTLQSIVVGNVASLADQQLIRYLIALAILMTTALVPPTIWMRASYPLFALSIILVLLVPLIGVNPPGAGAKRWLMIGGVSVQPSELLKIALVLGLARYFHSVPSDKISHPFYLIVPVLMILLPLFPIFMQPDLGTALLVAMIGAGIIFLAGVNSLYFLTAVILVVSSLPFCGQI